MRESSEDASRNQTSYQYIQPVQLMTAIAHDSHNHAKRNSGHPKMLSIECEKSFQCISTRSQKKWDERRISKEKRSSTGLAIEERPFLLLSQIFAISFFRGASAERGLRRGCSPRRSVSSPAGRCRFPDRPSEAFHTPA